MENADKRKYLLRAVALDGANSYALVNLAMHLMDDLGVNPSVADQCLRLLKRALIINPNLFYARPTIAQLYVHLNKYEEARDMLSEHLSLRPEDTRSRHLHTNLNRALARA